jgi:hypothetical protein
MQCTSADCGSFGCITDPSDPNYGDCQCGSAGTTGGTGSTGTTGSSCPGYADPNTPASCNCASGHSCAANNCYNGYYCNLSTLKCVPPPSGC